MRTGPTEFVGLREHIPLVHDVHGGHCLGDDFLIVVVVLVVVVLESPSKLLQQLQAAHHDVGPWEHRHVSSMSETVSGAGGRRLQQREAQRRVRHSTELETFKTACPGVEDLKIYSIKLLFVFNLISEQRNANKRNN